MRKVVFDPGSAIAQIDWFYLTPGADLSMAVTAHVARTARFKRGDWFVNVAPGANSGHLFFRGKTSILTFGVEGKD